MDNPWNTLRRLAARVRRDRLEDELREEIEGHIELRRQQLVDEGMDPREAPREARRMFGNATALREEARDMWSIRWLETLAQDVRFGGRLLARAPLFTAVVVLSLATGIGASVAVFTIADAVLFRPLDVKDPDQLRAFRATVSLGGARKVMSGADAETFARISADAGFGDVAAFRATGDIDLESAGTAAAPVRVDLVSGNYFAVARPRLLSGRPLDDADQHESAFPVVITDGFWRRQFTSDAAILGKSIAVNGQRAVVVGIVERFRGLVPERPADVFAPLAAAGRIDPATSSGPATLVARLNPDVTTAVAEERLQALIQGGAPSVLRAGELQVELPDASRGISDLREPLERPLWMALGLVGVLLIVACANTAGLLLARLVSRQTEFGIRAAIGAGRGRLARQLVAEALLLAAVAGSIGLAGGWAAAPLLMRVMPETHSPAAVALMFDGRLAAFTAVVTMAAAGGATAASLLRLWRSPATSIAGGETRSVACGSHRLMATLIGAQVACSLLLVVGAVAMWRTLDNLRAVSPGFDLDGVLAVTIDAAGLLPSPAAAADYHARVRERIAAAPGVRRASMAQLGLLTAAATTGTVDVPGFSYESDEDRWSRMFFVGPDYFATVGIPIVRGRGLTTEDHAARVAVVSETFATFYVGGLDRAVGAVVNRDVRIVGVAADARYNTLREPSPRAMFVPYAGAQRAQMTHFVRATGDPTVVMRTVREAIASHDSRLRPRFSTADELLATSLARERFFATIAAALSILALLLACAGLYGAVAYAVSQRRQELAVRMALGAAPRDIATLMLTRPLQTTLAGIVVGVPASYLVMRSAGSLLFGVSPLDLSVVLPCAAALLLAALAAALWPAWRAMRIDPITALHAE